ncbi:MAG: hypothetical protein KatS3mg108_3106 [Isosphaeraceae bacterium]|jgi:ubiquinone/menaquinone biosynthesis C-methylase UbiE|nr:MAG: hypothetical protein KatS3mg108_3106 [Isosphaeraceae bacterium]
MRWAWVVVVAVGVWGDGAWGQSSGEGWICLTDGEGLAAWRLPHGQWASVAGVRVRESDPRYLEAEPGRGPVLYNGPRGRTPNLISREWFGDVALRCQFLIPKGSNSGIKFAGLYEIQIADSYGKAVATASDCGGIYPRAELFPRYRHIDAGIPPRENACGEPGTWQSLEVVFRAPRFDQAGKKVRRARFERVVLNGKVIHEGVELAYPTGHAWQKAEVPEGPILLQGDHGPVAFRGLEVRRLEPEPAQATREGGINRPFEAADLKVEEFVERFESEDREIYAKRQEIVEFVGLKPGESVADVGAGTGLFTRLFAEKVGPEGRVYAVDIAKPFLEHIERSARERGWRHVRTVLGDQESTHLPEESLDVVFICDTYHHFEKPDRVMASIHRALKPGGRLVLVEFDRREGVSSAFVLNHIRASRGEFEAEIEAAGFEKQDAGEPPSLRENFVTVFRKVERPAAGGR